MVINVENALGFLYVFGGWLVHPPRPLSADRLWAFPRLGSSSSLSSWLSLAIPVPRETTILVLCRSTSDVQVTVRYYLRLQAGSDGHLSENRKVRVLRRPYRRLPGTMDGVCVEVEESNKGNRVVVWDPNLASGATRQQVVV